ncbi:hypothetical protein [Piscibacillus halophilus]|uniref:hypothetical protein n=1 Tax=Piscibacillus halophilus TaxID=571933 RepID=UPI00158B7293|nr:hypothetical protein [Piscibacillus halophilus]
MFKKVLYLIVSVVLVASVLGMIRSYALLGNDELPNFYSSDYTIEERFAYELHTVVDGILCDCEEQYIFPTEATIQNAIEKRVPHLTSIDKSKLEQAKQLAEEYVNSPYNNVGELSRQLSALKNQLKSSDNEKETEEEIERIEQMLMDHKSRLKEQAMELHDLVEEFDRSINGDYYEDQHEEKGIN